MDATFWVGAAFVLFVGILVYLKVPGMLTGALTMDASLLGK